ncbi:GvpL/GvpF family gas vesicle protein [Qaidamihabitans albus]|uniref:GvpL/GvpF family gas vesicle protein n=1 Tax=Qaidamihabitans albus TaxID=2795733 RepID=UPI0018F11FD4|nr:GvpL/GvpF family gas vesicle protein [Qaidamihabitans albus]
MGLLSLILGLPLAPVRGVIALGGGEPARTVEAAGLVAVVSTVDLAEYGEQPLRRNLEDLDWLAATARAHDAVVHTVARSATAAVPLRLATVYLGDERVRVLLADRRTEFAVALDRLAGRTEWGVKGYADPDALAAPPRSGDEAAAGRGSGTAYLLRRRAQLSARESAERTAAEHAGRLHAALTDLSVAGRRHAPQDPNLSGQRAWMVLNGSYLVDDARADEFAAAVSDLDGERSGVSLELTGPWPPYSFSTTVLEVLEE